MNHLCKQIIFACFIFVVPFSLLHAASGVITLNGIEYPIDTLDHYQVGPGVSYTHFAITYAATRK